MGPMHMPGAWGARAGRSGPCMRSTTRTYVALAWPCVLRTWSRGRDVSGAAPYSLSDRWARRDLSGARTRAHACTGAWLVSRFCHCQTLHPDHSSAMITGKRQAWLQGKPWISGPWSLDPALAPGPCLGPWPFGPCPDPWPLALALAPARGPWPVAPSPGLGPCPGSLAFGACPDTYREIC